MTALSYECRAAGQFEGLNPLDFVFQLEIEAPGDEVVDVEIGERLHILGLLDQVAERPQGGRSNLRRLMDQRYS